MAASSINTATLAEATAYLTAEKGLTRQQLAQDIGRYLLTKEDPNADQTTLNETLRTIALITAYIAGDTTFVRFTKPGNRWNIAFAFGIKPARW